MYLVKYLPYGICVILTFFCSVTSACAYSSLDAMLEPYLEKYQLPALAAAVVKNGEIVAAGATGTRRAGTKMTVSLDDRFHLGSDTKAMTSLLAATLVESKKLRWDSTVADIFPELAGKMNPALRKVTLQQLLSHTSGIPGDNDEFATLLGKAMFQDGNLDEMRYWLVEQWSLLPLESSPGKKFAYANMNYVIAGAMIERTAGKTWEELITELIFEPLGLKSAGLGPQATLGRIDATLGHISIDGKLKAFLSGPNGDNPPIIGPAGNAHMSVLDFARWAGWNAGEGKRGPKLVQAETLKKLHTPVVSMPLKQDARPGTPSHGKYALGWGEVQVDWAPEPLLYHGGSNVKNLAFIWVEPKHDFAMVLMTNAGGEKADQALHALSQELYRLYAVGRR
jgi:CubicO group peptidase (beta-lactamase class C family)